MHKSTSEFSLSVTAISKSNQFDWYNLIVQCKSSSWEVHVKRVETATFTGNILSLENIDLITIRIIIIHIWYMCRVTPWEWFAPTCSLDYSLGITAEYPETLPKNKVAQACYSPKKNWCSQKCDGNSHLWSLSNNQKSYCKKSTTSACMRSPH